MYIVTLYLTILATQISQIVPLSGEKPRVEDAFRIFSASSSYDFPYLGRSGCGVRHAKGKAKPKVGVKFEFHIKIKLPGRLGGMPDGGARLRHRRVGQEWYVKVLTRLCSRGGRLRGGRWRWVAAARSQSTGTTPGRCHFIFKRFFSD